MNEADNHETTDDEPGSMDVESQKSEEHMPVNANAQINDDSESESQLQASFSGSQEMLEQSPLLCGSTIPLPVTMEGVIEELLGNRSNAMCHKDVDGTNALIEQGNLELERRPLREQTDFVLFMEPSIVTAGQEDMPQIHKTNNSIKTAKSSEVNAEMDLLKVTKENCVQHD